MLTERQKELKRASQKRYAEKNKDKVAAAIKKWNSENKDKLLIASKNYYNRNKDDLEFKKSNAKKTRDWFKKHPVKVLEQSSRKRATKLNRTPLWLNSGDLFEIECVYTYAKSLNNIGLNYHVDHIIPLRGKKVSGLHIASNLQVIPAIENLIKSNKFYEELNHG
jgi:hypothetical protein